VPQAAVWVWSVGAGKLLAGLDRPLIAAGSDPHTWMVLLLDADDETSAVQAAKMLCQLQAAVLEGDRTASSNTTEPAGTGSEDSAGGIA